MERVGYNVVLNLANFFGVDVEKREVNGIMEDVLVLPLRINGFYYSRRRDNRGIYLYGKALPSDINHCNQSHFLVASLNKKLQKELTDLGYRTTIYFGNMSIMFASEGKSRPANNSRKLDDVLNQDF